MTCKMKFLCFLAVAYLQCDANLDLRFSADEFPRVASGTKCDEFDLVSPSPGDWFALNDNKSFHIEMQLDIKDSDVDFHISLLTTKPMGWKKIEEIRNFRFDLRYTGTSKTRVQLDLGLLYEGIHTVAFNLHNKSNLSICAFKYHFLVYRNDLLPNRVDCPGLLPRTEFEISSIQTFGEHAWHRTALCLREYLLIYTENIPASILLANLDLAIGNWKLAEANLDTVLIHSQSTDKYLAAIESNHEMASAMMLVDAPPSCSWDIRPRFACAGSNPASSTGDFSSLECQSKTVSEGLDADGELFLSVIMAFRHDDSVYCQNPPDACVDRLRTSLSLLLHLMAKHDLAPDAEVILVEWNPCHSRVAAPCRPRPGGYRRAVEVVRETVAAPAAPATVRVIEVPEAVHEGEYNPYGYDHFEFHAKNTGARRARGRFLVFTNPDDVWPEALVELLVLITLILTLAD